MRHLFNTPNLLRLYRVVVVAALGWLVHLQARWIEVRRAPALTIEQAQRFFPAATRVQLRDAERGIHYVLNARGNTLGLLLATSPHADDIIGYSGPNNVLIALDADGAVAGLELLRSGDTPEHVGLVLRDPKFLRALVGWKPGQSARTNVAAVSGATLTSFAIAEAVQQRLSGTALSLRFPEPLKLEEVKTLFPDATRFTPDGRRHRVFDRNGHLLGYALRTSPQADNVSGYRGPTEALAAMAPDGRTVTTVRVRSSYDTESYVNQIREDNHFLKLLQGRTIEEIATLDFKKEKIEGVSGATLTSFAIAEGLKRRAAAELDSRREATSWRPRLRDWGLTAVIAGALVMAFTPLRGQRWVRFTWQALLIGYVGVVNADLLSLALFGGWAAHGLALKTAPGLLLLLGAALLVPAFSRRQLYCHQICPHGAAQQLLGRIFRRRWSLPPSLGSWLEKLPMALLLFAVLVLLLGWPVNLAAMEPFDAWAWRAAGAATLAIAIAGLVASIFIPQAYCRFGCPTGALLNFVRTKGSADSWSRRDWAGLAFVATALIATAISRATVEASPPPMTTLTGRTMGTTWTVKIRNAIADSATLQNAIAEKFEWCEQMTSHWRTNTEITLFNRAHTTDPIFMPFPVAGLVRESAGISRATDGAFDITVGPLVRLWGFGPAPRRSEPPGDSEITNLLAAVGWQKLELRGAELRKQHPDLEIDLSAIAPGWAIDEVAGMLELRGFPEFLIESGGELRAGGNWAIAIEHPARRITLRDESLGTSGTYRQNWKAGRDEFSHLIDPRTGRPILHDTVTVSVRHSNCAQADAWAAALNVLGVERGLPLAERLGLGAQFVVRQPNGALRLHSTTNWIGSPKVTKGG